MGRGSAQHSVLHLRRQTGDTTGGSTVSSTDSGSSSSTPDSSTPTTTPSSSDPPSTTTTPTSDPPTTTPVSTSATAVTTQVSSSSSSKNSVSSTSTSLSIEKSSTSSVASPTAQSTKQSSTSTSSAAVVSSETSSTAVPLGSSTVYSTTQLSKTKEPSVVTSVAIVSGTDTASLNFASASDSSATVSSEYIQQPIAGCNPADHSPLGSTANPSLGSSEAQTARPLSQQASAGIAIGVLLVLLAIASVIIFTINRRKHRKSQVLDSWMKALEGQQKATVEDHAATLKQSASVKSYRLTEEEKLELQPYRAPYAPPPLPMTEKQSNQLVPDRTSNQEFLTELRAGPYGDPEPTTPSIPLHFGFDDQSKNGVIEHSYDMRSQQSPSPEFTPGDDRELSSVSLNEPTKPRPVHRAERMKKVPPVRWSVQHDHAK